MWKSLPTDLRVSSVTAATFAKHLRTYLFFLPSLAHLNSARLYFRQTVNSSKRAKISDICLAGCQGKHSALTDAQKIYLKMQSNQTQKLVEIKNNELTIKTYLHCNLLLKQLTGLFIWRYMNARIIITTSRHGASRPAGLILIHRPLSLLFHNLHSLLFFILGYPPYFTLVFLHFLSSPSFSIHPFSLLSAPTFLPPLSPVT